ncbi:unnamed protein product [Brassica napus]|uniref:(rape) hypothetical protein n=1 Tax=Brassica napus TaxID=3708 RepID=A0A816SKP9_BRANA|nr:unnamed protein product [Brassica napus]
MSTTGRERHSVLRIFKGRRNAPTPRDAAVLQRPPRPPTHRGLALAPTAGLSPLYPSQKNDLHVSIAAGLHQSFLWLRPRPGIVHHFGSRQACSHSNPSQKIKVGRLCTREDPANQLPCALRDALPAPIRFPPDNFKQSLTLFSKSFSSLPRGTCSPSVSPIFSLDGIYRPIGAAFPNNPTQRQRLVVRQGPGTTGLSPSLAPLSRELGPGPSLRTLLQTNSTPKTSGFSSWALS